MSHEQTGPGSHGGVGRARQREEPTGWGARIVQTQGAALRTGQNTPEPLPATRWDPRQLGGHRDLPLLKPQLSQDPRNRGRWPSHGTGPPRPGHHVPNLLTEAGNAERDTRGRPRRTREGSSSPGARPPPGQVLRPEPVQECCQAQPACRLLRPPLPHTRAGGDVSACAAAHIPWLPTHSALGRQQSSEQTDLGCSSSTPPARQPARAASHTRTGSIAGPPAPRPRHLTACRSSTGALRAEASHPWGVGLRPSHHATS